MVTAVVILMTMTIVMIYEAKIHKRIGHRSEVCFVCVCVWGGGGGGGLG